MQVSGMVILPFSLPTKVSCACICQVYLPCAPTYRGMSRKGLACGVALCPYLQKSFTLGYAMLIHPMFRPTEACHVRVWHVKSPYVPTYKSLSLWGLVCLFDLRPFLHRPVALGSLYLLALHPYLQRFVTFGFGMLIHPPSLPTEACHAKVLHV